MTLLAPSAPLVAIAHDWTAPVERVTAYPSSVMTHWDGSEQRQSLSHLPSERITYRLIAPTWAEAIDLNLLPKLAADALVRVPRWEDQSRVSAEASAGSAVVIACDTTDRATFAVGAEVILWRSSTNYEVTTIDAVASGSITADLAESWAAGTIVAPISEARLVYGLDVSHWAPTSGIPELTVDVGLRDLAGLGTGGTAVAGVPAAISVTAAWLRDGGRNYMVATVTDAVGNVLSGADIVWSSADATKMDVWASGEPGVAIVAYLGGLAINGTVVITATLGAVSGTANAGYSG